MRFAQGLAAAGGDSLLCAPSRFDHSDSSVSVGSHHIECMSAVSPVEFQRFYGKEEEHELLERAETVCAHTWRQIAVDKIENQWSIRRKFKMGQTSIRNHTNQRRLASMVPRYFLPQGFFSGLGLLRNHDINIIM